MHCILRSDIGAARSTPLIKCHPVCARGEQNAVPRFAAYLLLLYFRLNRFRILKTRDAFP